MCRGKVHLAWEEGRGGARGEGYVGSVVVAFDGIAALVLVAVLLLVQSQLVLC